MEDQKNICRELNAWISKTEADLSKITSFGRFEESALKETLEECEVSYKNP